MSFHNRLFGITWECRNLAKNKPAKSYLLRNWRTITSRRSSLSLVAALGGFLFGFDSGIINGTVEALQGEFGSDEVGTGFNVASMLLASAVGAFFAGNLADKFGRRPTMIFTATRGPHDCAESFLVRKKR